MCFSLVMPQGKSRAEDVLQSGGIVPLHREAAAFFRPIIGKRGKDEMAAGFERMQKYPAIGLPVFWMGQEMEYRAIMPEIKGMLTKIYRGDVCFDPLNALGLLAQSVLAGFKRGPRQIKYGEMVEIQGQKIIDEGGSSPTHIDQCR